MMLSPVSLIKWNGNNKKAQINIIVPHIKSVAQLDTQLCACLEALVKSKGYYP